MRSYFNGGGGGGESSVTPPASAAYGMGGRRSTAGSASLLPTPRSSASLPRSPDNPSGIVNNGGGSMMHGSNQEVYVNIYQNTNHPSLFVSCSLLSLQCAHFLYCVTQS